MAQKQHDKTPTGRRATSGGREGPADVHERGRRRGPDPAEQDEDAWNFPFEAELHAIAPGLHDAQNAWLSQIDSLRAPDRKTHELIRMVCTVIMRNRPGVVRHARLAAEVGATWEEIAGSIFLTEPAFGLLPVVEALPWARRGFERGSTDMKEAKKARKPA
ncbi:MAG TPA: hypothetical protein VMR97_14905 [Acidimicrobiales bacterium]|nr:hypothetical protein [Acidimicrobiales bacterium]